MSTTLPLSNNSVNLRFKHGNVDSQSDSKRLLGGVQQEESFLQMFKYCYIAAVDCMPKLHEGAIKAIERGTDGFAAACAHVRDSRAFD